MPLPLTLQVDDLNRVIARCDADLLTPPTPLTDLRAITNESNPYRFAPEPLGAQLFAALGGLALLERLAATNDRLLLLDTDERAASVPWEYAYTGSEFLACEVGLLRLLPAPSPALPHLGGGRQTGALNFIALAADPLVDGAGNVASGTRLAVEHELQQISAVLRQSNVQNAVQNTVALTAQRVPPLLSHLQRGLRSGPTLLHLSCHGSVQRISEYGVEKEVAFLALEDANGKLTLVRGDRLVNLAPRGVLRLIVLSACQSALSGAPGGHPQGAAREDANLARALVRHGVPAAIGMQGDFPDALSDELAATLYESLLAGYDLGEALRQTRWRLRLAAPHAVGLPVAYVAPGGWAPLPLQEGRPQVRDMTPARYTSLPLSLQPPAQVVGREAELHNLALAFARGQEDPALERQGSHVVTVVGTGGIGKTVLAATFAARFGWRWPGGVIGVSLADLPTLRAETVLLALLERLGADTRALADRPADKLAELLLLALQERQCLVLVDNYESVLELLPGPAPSSVEGEISPPPSLPQAGGGTDALAAQTLHHLLAGLAQRGVPCLLTSRQQPAGFVGEIVFPAPDQPLDGLTVAAGAELFFAHCPSAAANRPHYTPLAQQVAGVTEGHPLAIALLGGEYETSRDSVTPEQFLAQWGVELAAARRPGLAAHHVTFAVAFERSFRHLHTEQQRRLLALGRFPAPFFAEGAALVWGEALADEAAAHEAQLTAVRQTLSDLVGRSMLKVDGRFGDSDLPATYRLDPVIGREVRRRTARTQEGADQGYAAYAAWLVNRAFGQTGSDVGMARLVQQWLDELIAQSEGQPPPEQAWYAWRLAWLCHQFGRLDEAEILLTAGRQAARDQDDEEALGRLHHQLANLLVVRGDLDQALQLYQESLAIQEKLGDIGGRSATLHEIARVYVTRGDLDQALQLYQESLAIQEKLGDIGGRSATLHAMANVYVTRGDLDQALQLYQESLAIKEKLGDIGGRSATLHAMANVYVTRGDLDQALQLYQESLAIQEKLGDIGGRSATLHAMANVYVTRGDLDQALQLYQESLAIQEKLGDIGGRSATLHAMANVYVTRGDLDQALQLYQESLAIDEKLGDIGGRSATLHAMANVYVTRGDLDQALQLYQESLAIDEKLGDIGGRSATLHAMANVYVTRGDLDQALQLYQESLAIQEKLGDIGGRSATLHAMANVYVTRGDLDQALQLYQESLAIKEKLGDIRGRSATLHAMANVYVTRGDLDQALQLYQESLAIKEKLGDIGGRSATLHEIARVYVTRGDLDQALQLYQESLAIKEKLGDIGGRSATLHAMANVYVTRGDLDQALQLYQESLAIDEKLGDIGGRSATLHAMANVYVTRGDLDQALQLYQESLAIQEKLGDIGGRSATLHEIARVYVTRGDLDQALQLYQESLAIQEKLGDIGGRSATLHAMANVYVTRGDLDQALQLYQESLAIKEKLGDIRGRSATLHAMANVYVTRGDLDQALQLYQESLAIKEKLGDIGGRSATLHEIARVYVTRGDLDQALQLYQESLAIQEKLGDIGGRSATLHAMATVYVTRGELDQALTLYQESLAIQEKLGDIRGRSATLSMLANLFMERQDWEQVERLLQEALALSQQLRDPSGIAFNLVKLGQVAQARGDRPTARRRYEEGLVIFARLGMPQANQVRAMLAALDGDEGERTEAVTPEQALLALVQAASAGQHPPGAVADGAAQLAAAPELPPEMATVATVLAAALRTPAPESWAALQTAAAALLAPEVGLFANNPTAFPFALARLFDRYDQPALAVPVQARAIEHLRQQGDGQRAQEALSIALYNGAGYLANAGRLAEAVAALAEVVGIDERFGLADLESDRQALAAMRQRLPGGASFVAAAADEEAEAETPAAALLAHWESQLAHLPPAEAVQMRQALDAFARLSPDEQAALALAAQQQRIDDMAQQTVDAALAAVRNGQVAELLPQLHAAAAHLAADEEADSPFAALAHFVEAVAAQLAGAPLPAIPAAHAARWLAFQQALALSR